MLYEKNPRATIIGTIAGILIGGSLIAYFTYKSQVKQQELERKRTESLSYNQQLDALNNVQGSLQNLIQFVVEQKLKLKESEDIINTLKTEQEKLRPVVEADRQTVNAILELQSQKQQQGAWWERGIGFALGVLSSALASAIISLVRYLLKKRQSAPATA